MIQKAKTQPEYLTVEEFAALTPLSISTIRRYLKNGQLPSLQPGGPGGKIMIRRDALELLNGSAGFSSGSFEAPKKPSEKLPGPAPGWMR